jgi:predicted transcriptional regulator
MTRAVSVKLSDSEHERISALAKRSKRSTHFLMREALLEFVAREEFNQSFHDEAEAAWIDYKETGEHLSLDTMMAWLKSGKTELPPWEK